MPTNDRGPNGPRDVLTGLPHARPTRRSAKRDAGPRRAGADVPAAVEGAAAKPAASRSRATGKRAGAGERRASAKAAADSEQRTPARRTAPQSRAAGKPAGAGARRRKTSSARTGAAEAQRPQVPPAGYATPTAGDPTPEPLRGGALVTTAVEAVGELAQLGVTAGVQGLRSVLRRLPRP